MTINGVCAEFNPSDLILDHQHKIHSNGSIDMSLENKYFLPTNQHQHQFLSVYQWSKLSLVFGYNSSDSTYGWDGNREGYNIYFAHFTEKYIRLARAQIESIRIHYDEPKA